MSKHRLPLRRGKRVTVAETRRVDNIAAALRKRQAAAA